MLSDVEQKERRKYQRYQVKDLAIAVTNKPTSQIGRIVNISKGGMAVRYVDHNDWLENADAIDILINSNFFMTNIPIHNVSDFKVKNQVSFSIINERQCCLQFGSLSPEHEVKLDEFIQKYTTGSS